MKGKQLFSSEDVKFIFSLIREGVKTKEDLDKGLTLLERLAYDASPAGLMSLVASANKLRDAYYHYLDREAKHDSKRTRLSSKQN